MLIAIAHVVLLVTVCLHRKKTKNSYVNTTPNVAYKSTSDQCIMRANEAYVDNRENYYSYAVEPTLAILATNTAYNARTAAESDISCSNDYAVTSGETQYEYVSTTGQNDHPISTFPNKAYAFHVTHGEAN